MYLLECKKQRISKQASTGCKSWIAIAGKPSLEYSRYKQNALKITNTGLFQDSSGWAKKVHLNPKVVHTDKSHNKARKR